MVNSCECILFKIVSWRRPHTNAPQLITAKPTYTIVSIRLGDFESCVCRDYFFLFSLYFARWQQQDESLTTSASHFDTFGRFGIVQLVVPQYVDGGFTRVWSTPHREFPQQVSVDGSSRRNWVSVFFRQHFRRNRKLLLPTFFDSISAATQSGRLFHWLRAAPFRKSRRDLGWCSCSSRWQSRSVVLDAASSWLTRVTSCSQRSSHGQSRKRVCMCTSTQCVNKSSCLVVLRDQRKRFVFLRRVTCQI